MSYAVINLGSLGGPVSVPLALNNHGEVVGWSATAGNATAHAFLYRKGRMTDLGTLGGKVSGATGINNHGEIVGMSNVAPGSARSTPSSCVAARSRTWALSTRVSSMSV